MSSSSTVTSLECFAMAIKLVVQAAIIDTRMAPLVPKVADSFATVAKNPNAMLAFKSDMVSSKSVAESSGSLDEVDPPSSTLLLVEAIRVLSISAPIFPIEVSLLIPLVINHMSPAHPSGFPLTEVGGETRTGSLEHQNETMLESNQAQVTSIESLSLSGGHDGVNFKITEISSVGSGVAVPSSSHRVSVPNFDGS